VANRDSELMNNSNGMSLLSPRVFVFFSGPYKNVGDALIRRRALAWARLLGEPHVLVGGAKSSEWDEAVGVTNTDKIYRSKLTWLRGVLMNSGRRPVLVIEPGEFNTDRRFLKLLVVLFGVSLLIRVRGGSVVQMPRSMARVSPFGKALYSGTLSKRGTTLWRERLSWNLFDSRGVVVPDIGFDDPDSLVVTAAVRDTLVISLRSDRDAPAAEMLAWLKKFAVDRGLKTIAVSQVAEDDIRTRAVATELGSEILCWDDRTSNEQEAILRDVYTRTALVWSDRLHVLVLGALHGAVPVEIVSFSNGKIAKHFDAIGVRNVAFDASTIRSEQELAEILEMQLGRRGDIALRVEAARLELIRTRDTLLTRARP
jgi:hypothetical protein